jgi:hypothetical protein
VSKFIDSVEDIRYFSNKMSNKSVTAGTDDRPLGYSLFWPCHSPGSFHLYGDKATFVTGQNVRGSSILIRATMYFDTPAPAGFNKFLDVLNNSVFRLHFNS